MQLLFLFVGIMANSTIEFAVILIDLNHSAIFVFVLQSYRGRPGWSANTKIKYKSKAPDSVGIADRNIHTTMKHGGVFISS